MPRLISTAIAVVSLSFVLGCGDDANKGVNKGKDKPAPAKTETK